MKIKQLVYTGMSVLVMVLIGHGINDNRLRVREKMEFMAFHFDSKHLHQRMLAIRNE